MKKEAPKDLGIRSLLSQSLLMLLLCYGFRIISDLGSSSRGAIGHRRDPDRAGRSAEAHDHGRPIRPVAYVRCERTDLYAHSPSLLEPILP